MNIHDPFAQPVDEVRLWTCPEHELQYGDGQPEPRRTTWECPKCKRRAELAEQDFRDLHANYDWWLNQSGIPERYRSAVPASIQPLSPSSKALARAVAAYTSDIPARFEEGAGLTLLGPPGLGKTVALTAVVNVASRGRRGSIYAVWPDVIAEVKAGFGGLKDDPRRQAIERLRDARFLALDELGVKGQSDFGHGELFGLIDYRYRQQLPTLVAANATPANFSALVGERIADRLKEMGPQLVLAGDSQRGKVSIAGPDAFPAPPEQITVRVHERGEWRDRTFQHRERAW